MIPDLWQYVILIMAHSMKMTARDIEPEALVDTPASVEFRESFLVEAANPHRRKIRVMSPDEYGVYIDVEGIAKASYGWKDHQCF